MAVKVTKTTLPGIIKEQVEGTPLQLPTAEPDSTDIRVIAPNATYHGSRYVVYNQHVWMSDDAKHILVRNEITSFDGTTIEAGAGSVALLSVEHPGVIKNAEFLAAKDPWQRFCISSVTGISKIITASTQAVSDTIQGFSKGLRGAFAEQVVTFLWALGECRMEPSTVPQAD